MPCNSDYLEQSSFEKHLQETAILLKYVYTTCGVPTVLIDPDGNEIAMPTLSDVSKAAEEYYCTKDYVANLCAYIRSLSEVRREDVVYNAKNKLSRRLADWWEDHLVADARRRREVERERKKRELKKQALQKLTKDEIEALDIK